jgi:CHAD domain-containing protein
MKRYVAQQLSRLLGRLVFEMRRALRSPDPDAIHDLRVAGRRLTESLRMFRSLLPGRETHKIRRSLKKLRQVTSKLRDRDITLELFQKAGIKPSAPVCRRLATERAEAERALSELLKQWAKRDFSARWRTALRLRTS